MFPPRRCWGSTRPAGLTYVRERRKQVVGPRAHPRHEDHIGGSPTCWRHQPPSTGPAHPGTAEGQLGSTACSTRPDAGDQGAGRLRWAVPAAGSCRWPTRSRLRRDGHHDAGGQILFTGDWKLDPTPVDARRPTSRASASGREGIDLMLSDSTTPSCRDICPRSARREAVREVVRARGRVVIACFASTSTASSSPNAARETGRLVASSARNGGATPDRCPLARYLDVRRVVVRWTGREEPGGQGDHRLHGSRRAPLGLSLMAVREPQHIKLAENDTVFFSANPSPATSPRCVASSTACRASASRSSPARLRGARLRPRARGSSAPCSPW